MAQKKIISAIGAVIGIVVVCLVVIWFQQPQLQDVARMIVMSEDMSCYLVDHTDNRPIIYETASDGSIVNFLRTAKEDGQQEIINIVWDGEGISYLKQIYDRQGQVFYKLYSCDSRLEQEIDQGNVALKAGERPLKLTKSTGQWELVTLDNNYSQIRVYQISEHRQSENNSLKLLQEVKAGKKEWFCDAAYHDHRVYILNNYGRVKCYYQGNREKNKKLYRRKTTGITAVRAGVCCELRTGKLELWADGTFIKLDVTETLWALDAISTKTHVQLAKRGTEERYLIFYHSNKKEEVSSIKLPWRMWIPFCKSGLLRTISLVLLIYVMFALIWFWTKRSKRDGSLTIMVVIGQIVLGIFLVCGIAIGRQFLVSKQQEQTGQLWALSITERLEELDFYTMDLQGFAKNGFLERLQMALKTQIFEMEGQWVQQSTAVISAKPSETMTVLASGDYAYGRQIDADIPREILQMIEKTRERGQIQTRITDSKFIIFSGENQNTVWSVLPVKERVVPSIFLIMRLKFRGQNNLVWLWLIIGWLAAELFLSVVVSILQKNSIHRFAKAVEASIEGTRRKSPVHWQGAFTTAWVEIQKQLASLERKKNQQSEYQADYDRFIPKYFAELMGHHDIRDLKLGEQCEVKGTFFHVLAGEPEKLMQKNGTYIQQVNELLALFNNKAAISKRMIFSENNDPGKLCIIYKEQAQEALQSAIEIWQYLNDSRKTEEQMSIAFLLHYHMCLCGLTGSKKEVCPFVYAREMEILKNCTRFLQQAQVRLTITEELLPYLQQNQNYRYIGYVKDAKEEKQFRFYEILEVYPENEKQKRIATAERFSQALELFYQNDFYLARLLFMEILKECPEDHLAKHNLFVCERMFQAQSSEEISHQLVEIT